MTGPGWGFEVIDGEEDQLSQGLCFPIFLLAILKKEEQSLAETMSITQTQTAHTNLNSR